MQKKKRLFNYLYSVYHEAEGKVKGVQHYEYGFFRRNNAQEAKEYARILWNQWPKHRRWIMVTNENGTTIIDHSS